MPEQRSPQRPKTEAIQQTTDRAAPHARHRRLHHHRPRRTVQHLPTHRLPHHRRGGSRSCTTQPPITDSTYFYLLTARATRRDQIRSATKGTPYGRAQPQQHPHDTCAIELRHAVGMAANCAVIHPVGSPTDIRLTRRLGLAGTVGDHSTNRSYLFSIFVIDDI